MTKSNVYVGVVKPLLDRAAALALLILLSPVLMMAILLLAISNRGSVLFVQERIGKVERPFTMIKFRTMEGDRLTKVGAMLRKLSLDELPQLLNVLRGDMSLVGPRPLLVRYLPHYTQAEHKRHAVLPGITGWAQVNGRNNVSWTQRMQDDQYYAENVSILLDLKILLLTLFQWFKWSEADFETQHMEPFDEFAKRR